MGTPRATKRACALATKNPRASRPAAASARCSAPVQIWRNLRARISVYKSGVISARAHFLVQSGHVCLRLRILARRGQQKGAHDAVRLYKSGVISARVRIRAKMKEREVA